MKQHETLQSFKFQKINIENQLVKYNILRKVIFPSSTHKKAQHVVKNIVGLFLLERLSTKEEQRFVHKHRFHPEVE